MKPQDWQKAANPPPLPDLPNTSRAIELWLADLIKQCAFVENTLIQEHGKPRSNHFIWFVKDDETLEASLKILVDLVQVEIVKQ